jgi:hypothetical protein
VFACPGWCFERLRDERNAARARSVRPTRSGTVVPVAFASVADEAKWQGPSRLAGPLRAEEARPSGQSVLPANLPDGQISDLPVQPFSQKYFASRFNQISFLIPAIPSHTEGRCAASRTRVGMRWTLTVLLTRALDCGRRSRVVLMPRCWHQVSGSDSASDGGKKARSPGRARYKP